MEEKEIGRQREKCSTLTLMSTREDGRKRDSRERKRKTSEERETEREGEQESNSVGHKGMEARGDVGQVQSIMGQCKAPWECAMLAAIRHQITRNESEFIYQNVFR